MPYRKIALVLALAASGMAASQAALARQSASLSAVPDRSPILATPEQIAFEKQVLRILASASMRAEIRRVEALYAADPQGATPTGKATIKRAAHSIAAAAAQYAAKEEADRPAALWGVNAPHDWAGIQVPRSGYGIDNPDNVYRNIMIDGAARYEIRGRIIAPGPAEQHFELRDSIPGTGGMQAEGGRQLATLHSDQIAVNKDGSFTISVDSDPANGRPNHLQTPAEGKYLLIVRDLFTNWATQHPIALDVRRIAGPPIGQPRTDAEMTQRAVSLLSQIAPYWLNYDNQFVYTKPANHIARPRVRPGGRGFSAGGHFTLKPDEAWVVTLSALGAVSLGFQLTDPWGVSYDYVNRTSSLNNVQARPNADGTYTFVISERDPGVYNWLDPEDHAAGLFAIRWQSLPAGAKPEDAVRASKIVPLAELKRALPTGTASITPAERATQRAERSASHARRLAE